MDSRFEWLPAIAISLMASTAVASPCFDISKGEPKTLSGTLEYVVFAGPPNFEDVQKGDTPEPHYVLKLAHAICITGDDFADPNSPFDAVQLNPGPGLNRQMKSRLRQTVTLTLTDQMGAETGHHHEPLLATVTAIASSPQPMDFTDEYGTAATTIRTFYEALGDGQGDDAALMIVPEKRQSGPLSAASLTRFYGHLKEPMRLIDISTAGPNQFVARYRYTTGAHKCDGRASITTVVRGGRNYIQAIHALDGC